MSLGPKLGLRAGTGDKAARRREGKAGKEGRKRKEMRVWGGRWLYTLFPTGSLED